MILIFRALVLAYLVLEETAALNKPGHWSKKAAPKPIVLPAGSLVKHGTTSNALSRILSTGLQPSDVVRGAALRAVSGKSPEKSGVYVAKSFAAYSTAAIGFAAKMYESASRGMDPKTPDDIPLPVVLNIRLKEDCMLFADEDYLRVDPDLRNAASPTDAVWQEYGSGAIIRPDGIPSDWIESVECPHVMSPELCVRLSSFWQSSDSADPTKLFPWDQLPDMKNTALYPGPHKEDAEELGLILDDAFRLVYAYDLSETKNSPLSKFERIERLEEGGSGGISYVTPTLAVTISPVNLQLRDSTDSTDRALMSSALTGSPNWDIYSTAGDAADRLYGGLFASERNLECHDREIELKAFSALLLNDCIQSLLQRLELERNGI